MTAESGRPPQPEAPTSPPPPEPTASPRSTIVESKPATATDDPAALWQAVAKRTSDNPSILVAVESSTLERIEQDRATLVITASVNAGYVRARRAALEELLACECGRPVSLEITEPEQAAPVSRPTTALDQNAQRQAMKNPVVRRAMELFDARIVEIADDDETQPGAIPTPPPAEM